MYDDYERGLLVGLLLGEGGFGRNRGAPCISVAMNPRHRQLLERLAELVPGSRLYGPYDYRDRGPNGREVMIWRARGQPALDLIAEIGDDLIALCPHVSGRMAVAFT